MVYGLNPFQVYNKIELVLVYIGHAAWRGMSILMERNTYDLSIRCRHRGDNGCVSSG